MARTQWHSLRVQLAHEYRRHLDRPESVPPLLAQQLLISGEDHRFFRHGGVDLVAICRAVWRGSVLGRREGASTIEMQIVRVVSGNYELTLRRKLLEIALATLVSREIPKRELPSIYLRIGYYGWRMNGYEAARSRVGLNPNSAGDLARLVARLKYPQPQVPSTKRWSQIETRSKHLLNLNERHSGDGTYAELGRKL
jgi:membrane carboxypeptidase/penicillin-binding protein PbpC